jgi:hypothetical protein
MVYNPAQILLAVESLRPGLRLQADFELADLNDGNGPFISAWKRQDVIAPTKEEIEAVDTDELERTGTTFLARDLLSQLTAGDYANIMQATAASPALGLLWASLLAQGEAPISVSADRFRQGWNGMSQALGVERAGAIARAIGIVS